MIIFLQNSYIYKYVYYFKKRQKGHGHLLSLYNLALMSLELRPIDNIID